MMFAEPGNCIVVLVTAPDRETARSLASSLLEARLAACVNILPGITSLYRWEGKIQEDQEQLLLIKTRTELLSEVTSLVRQEHPYELPETISLPITGGSKPYLEWILQETSP